MQWTDFLAWLCTLDQQRAYQIWKGAYLRSHPDKTNLPNHILVNHYNMDQQIRDYWRSPLGQLNHQMILFWYHVKHPHWRRRWFDLRRAVKK